GMAPKPSCRCGIWSAILSVFCIGPGRSSPRTPPASFASSPGANRIAGSGDWVGVLTMRVSGASGERRRRPNRATVWRPPMVAGAAIILATFAPAAAPAGTAQTDASSDPLKAAKAYFDYLGEHVPGMVDGLVDYSWENSQPTKCDR